MDRADQRDFDSHYEYWDKIKGVNGGEMSKKERSLCCFHDGKSIFDFMEDWLDAYFENNDCAMSVKDIMDWIYTQPMTTG